MPIYWKKHIFTAELPYEKDPSVTLFLRNKFERVDNFVMSLGQMSDIPPSKLNSYINGKLDNEKIYTKNNLKADGMLLYFYYIPKALIAVTIDMIRALRSIHLTCDIFFAQHFLPAFIAIMLRKTGILRCEKIIYWMFDFFLIPPQFPRSLYYQGIDLIQGYVRKHIDEIWYTTPRLVECDRQRFGPLPRNVTERTINGLFSKRIKTEKPPSIPPLRLAFLGSLRKNNAIYESIEAIYDCIQNGLNVELFVIGSGPEEKRLKHFVKEKNISNAIKFYGFEDNGEIIAKIFSQCHLGLALYPADPYSPNWFLTSGKFRRYISQRLPVIVSTVPYFTKYIYDFNAGIIVDNDPGEVRRALQKIYNSPSLLTRYQRGVDKLYTAFQADKILVKAFKDMFNETKTQ